MKPLSERRSDLGKRLLALWCSALLSIRGDSTPGPATPPRIGSRPEYLAIRLADCLGALLWICIWVYGLWVLASSTLWSLMLQMLGG